LPFRLLLLGANVKYDDDDDDDDVANVAVFVLFCFLFDFVISLLEDDVVLCFLELELVLEAKIEAEEEPGCVTIAVVFEDDVALLLELRSCVFFLRF